MTDFMHAAFSMAGDGRPCDALGRHLIRLTAEDTAGRMGVWDEPVAPGEGPPLHVHHREDELFRVLTGRFRFWCGDEEFDAGPGTCVLLPRGVPHRFQNVGSTEGLLMIAVTPGGFEGFFLEFERRAPTSPEEATEIAAAYGLEILA